MCMIFVTGESEKMKQEFSCIAHNLFGFYMLFSAEDIEQRPETRRIYLLEVQV